MFHTLIIMHLHCHHLMKHSHSTFFSASYIHITHSFSSIIHNTTAISNCICVSTNNSQSKLELEVFQNKNQQLIQSHHKGIHHRSHFLKLFPYQFFSFHIQIHFSSHFPCQFPIHFHCLSVQSRGTRALLHPNISNMSLCLSQGRNKSVSVEGLQSAKRGALTIPSQSSCKH